MDPQHGLWGTVNLHRVAVTLDLDSPTRIVGHVLEISVRKWIAEGDDTNREFDTPREAAEHGYRELWTKVLRRD
jgi:hypothetical protein